MTGVFSRNNNYSMRIASIQNIRKSLRRVAAVDLKQQVEKIDSEEPLVLALKRLVDGRVSRYPLQELQSLLGPGGVGEDRLGLELAVELVLAKLHKMSGDTELSPLLVPYASFLAPYGDPELEPYILQQTEVLRRKSEDAAAFVAMVTKDQAIKAGVLQVASGSLSNASPSEAASQSGLIKAWFQLGVANAYQQISTWVGNNPAARSHYAVTSKVLDKTFSEYLNFLAATPETIRAPFLEEKIIVDFAQNASLQAIVHSLGSSGIFPDENTRNLTLQSANWLMKYFPLNSFFGSINKEVNGVLKESAKQPAADAKSQKKQIPVETKQAISLHVTNGTKKIMDWILGKVPAASGFLKTSLQRQDALIQDIEDAVSEAHEGSSLLTSDGLQKACEVLAAALILVRIDPKVGKLTSSTQAIQEIHKKTIEVTQWLASEQSGMIGGQNWHLLFESIKNDIELWITGRTRSGMAPQAAKEIHDLLYPKLVTAIKTAGERTQQTKLAEGIIANLEVPGGMNDFFASFRSRTQTWFDKVLDRDPNPSINGKVVAIAEMLIQRLSAISAIEPEASATYLFNYISAQVHAWNHARLPKGVDMFPVNNATREETSAPSSYDNNVVPAAEDAKPTQEPQQKWQAADSDWLHPDVSGLASAVLLQLLQRTFNDARRPTFW
jgi:hypothetical protein